MTAPINKNNIQSEKFKFPGHTDYLAQELDGDSLMFMICDELKIGLLTDHVALKEINRHVTKQRIEQKISLKNKQDAQRAHIQSFVDRFKAKASKARQAQSRIKILEKMNTIQLRLVELFCFI